MCSLLPELHHSAGEVPGVCDAVVGEAALCVPGISTSLPWQFLEMEKKEKKITQTAPLFGPLSHRTVLSLHLSCSQKHDTHLGHWDFMLFREQ